LGAERKKGNWKVEKKVWPIAIEKTTQNDVEKIYRKGGGKRLTA